MDTNLINRLNEIQFQSLNQLIDQVAARQLKDFGQITSELKPDGTLITSCDRWSDQHIVNGLSTITNRKEGILSEEGSKLVPASDNTYLIALVGYEESCFFLVNLSSCAAATISPFTSIAAALS